jgi:transposase
MVRNRKEYNEGFKKAAVEKVLSSNSMGISGVASHLGIPITTLFSWKKKYANSFFMGKTTNKELRGDLTSEEKMAILLKTAKMSENELGEYLRSSGLNSYDLENFKNEFVSNSPGRGRPKLDPEIVELRKNNKDLTRDLNKKNKALAEMSARVILLKKSHLIWGDQEEEN